MRFFVCVVCRFRHVFVRDLLAFRDFFFFLLLLHVFVLSSFASSPPPSSPSVDSNFDSSGLFAVKDVRLNDGAVHRTRTGNPIVDTASTSDNPRTKFE